jgi:endonuclease YncB( thermonuclease family)
VRRQPLRDAGFVLLIGAFMLLPAGACAVARRQPSAPARPPDGVSIAPPAVVPVTSVVDGDTIHVRYRGRDERVRLIGMDTPEIAHGREPAECFADSAAAYTRDRLQGRTVTLRFDVRLRDPYGRLLAYVYLGHELVNLSLVRLGYADDDRVPPDTGMAGTFADAERTARAAGVGMWSACATA